MANGYGDPECVNCRFQAYTASGHFCNKYCTDLPTEIGGYLVCRLWQSANKKRVDTKWMNEYFPLEDTLYQFDPYMLPFPARVIKRLKS